MYEELRVFETFSGIGAQHSALKKISKREDFKFQIVGTSDWDVFSVQSYAWMHHYKKISRYNLDKIRKKDFLKFIEEYSFSKNGKNSININIEKWNHFINENWDELIENSKKNLEDKTKYDLGLKKINNVNFFELIEWYKAFDITNNIGSIVNSYSR